MQIVVIAGVSDEVADPAEASQGIAGEVDVTVLDRAGDNGIAAVGGIQVLVGDDIGNRPFGADAIQSASGGLAGMGATGAVWAIATAGGRGAVRTSATRQVGSRYLADMAGTLSESGL
mgnify:CR=1 FL=1